MRKWLIPITIGWMLIGKMELAHWEKLSVGEKKAIVNLVSDQYFKKSRCGGADFRILIDKEVQIYAQCTEPREEA